MTERKEIWIRADDVQRVLSEALEFRGRMAAEYRKRLGKESERQNGAIDALTRLHGPIRELVRSGREMLIQSDPEYAELWREIAEAWERVISYNDVVVWTHVRGHDCHGLCDSIKAVSDNAVVRAAMWDQLHKAVPEVGDGNTYVWPRTPDGARQRAAVARRIEASLRGEEVTNTDISKLNEEEIAAEVHNAWWREKEKQGFHPPLECQNWPLPHGEEESRDAVFTKHCEKCHTDMYPYRDLPYHIKEYDRATVRTVLNAIEQMSPSGIEGAKLRHAALDGEIDELQEQLRKTRGALGDVEEENYRLHQQYEDVVAALTKRSRETEASTRATDFWPPAEGL